jgi:signal recognition particle subunit SEC65
MTFQSTHELLASSLTLLKTVTDRIGTTVLSSRELSRVHRERLIAAGYLEPIIKGWLTVSRPAGLPRIMSAWSSVYWDFTKNYLNDRFGDQWRLDAVGSLRLLTENWQVPEQLVVCVPGKINQRIALPGNSSFYIYGGETLDHTVLKNGFRIFPLEMAIARLPIHAWHENVTDALTAISSLRSHSDILRAVLQDGMITRAGAAAGALRSIGRDTDADNIIKMIASLGHRIREINPLEGIETPVFDRQRQTRSPSAQRITVMWARMRKDVLKAFSSEGRPLSRHAALEHITNCYIEDALNSLRIEGYSVSPEMIEDTMRPDWQPDSFAKSDRNVLAAMGYRKAFAAVTEAVRRVLEGNSGADLVADEHQRWHALLFGSTPSYSYRDRPVYLGGSRHVPYPPTAVLDGMSSLLECIAGEPDARVRAVLGPFLLTYIHPYTDGNGRLARLMMNVLLVEGGFQWTVIPLVQRREYMESLEAASTQDDIRPLTSLISSLVGA